MKKYLNHPDLGLLIFRVFIGLSMAFAHGWGKIPPPEGLIARTESMGFPLPVLFAWSAGLAEFFGGLLIAAGLLTRVSSGFLGFTMAVAAFIAHAEDPYQRKELALLFLFSCVLLLLTGPGKYSLSRLLPKKWQ